jgi:ribosomal protein L20A (L18A)
MAKIKKFEDIESWKRARKLTKDIYTVTAQDKFRRDFGLKDQIRRAAVSILSNIAEALNGVAIKSFFSFLPSQKDPAVKLEPSSTLLLTSSTFHWRSLMRWRKRQLK